MSRAFDEVIDKLFLDTFGDNQQSEFFDKFVKTKPIVQHLGKYPLYDFPTPEKLLWVDAGDVVFITDELTGYEFMYNSDLKRWIRI